MREIVGTKRDLCVGCNRCVRECPIETANITYQDEKGNIKVRIDYANCIACGRCVSACKHEARYYEDDTELFFDDLKKGVPISVMAAPSVKANIPRWKNLFAYLKAAGVNRIYDVSLGADISIWAHVRYLEQNKRGTLITQPCPPVVSYCEKHRHDLLNKLSPVHSPMACCGIYMKEYEGVTDRLAALSPCIAKSNEFEETGIIQYNVTFAKLQRYLEKHNIALPEAEAEFDHYKSGLGAIFPTPGGLKENIEFFMGKSLRIDKAEGDELYNNLNVLSKTPENLLPRVYDVLNCAEGCNKGPGCTRGTNIFGINAVMDDCRKSATGCRDREYFEALYKKYDAAFELSRFIREYRPVYNPQAEVTERDIRKAFRLLDKDDFTKQNFDCGACGSDTCHNMARKIALKINIPINCIVKSRDRARDEHEKYVTAYRESVKNTKLIQDTLDRFETIWENVECGIVIVDAKNRKILDMNPEALRMYGAEKEKVVGRQCHRLICPAERHSCPIMDKNQTVDHSERKFINASGETVPIIKSVSKIHYKGRLALLECFADISHLKKVEEGLRLLKITEQANQAKSEFLSRMSHEMRTPMNAIIGMTKIAENSDDTGRLRYCLSMIGNSSAHLLGIINDILDMSKIEAGKFELSESPFNIEKMLMKICNLIIEKIEQKGIKFNINIGRNMRTHYTGDELRLSQVITNLMSNAVKFTPDGGEIKLTASETHAEDGYGILRFTVKDTGIGMTPEQMDKLFKAFEQGDGSISRQYGGTGLGLVISKNIVEKMDGRIWAESEFGKGSEFSFEVKLKRPEQRSGPIFAGNISPSDIKVLIADGDGESRSYLKSIIKSFGINADEAANGKTAVSLAEKAARISRPYDIIFLDYDLPDTDAFEIIRALSFKVDKNTVIIMTSFLKWNEIESTAYSLGVSKFLSKPLFPSAVLDAINEAIGKAAEKLDIARAGAENAPDFSKVSILLAEDVDINREIFIGLLENTNVKIDTAVNGREAVQKFQKEPGRYNLIIMDVQMPEMDGYTATRAIRSLGFERAKTIPIIAMTANVFKEDIEKCLESGMNDHLGKPIDLDIVVDKIKLYCK